MDVNQWSPTRRGFIVAAGAAGALAAGRLRHPRIAWAEGGDAREIPGTYAGIPGFPHVADPSPGNEPATIFDFDGVIAITRILGTGTAHGEAPSTMTFDCDMRFMSGRYIGADGTERQGAFAFV